MPLKLVIDNSYTQVQGMDRQLHSKLKKLLSYLPDAGNAFSGFPSRPRYLIDAKGYFPTGLVKRVLLYMLETGVDCALEDRRRVPATKVDHKPKIGHKPYRAQLEAIETALEQRRGCISMPTGTGKSLVIALIASRLQVRTLIVVPSLQIKKQLIDDLSVNFGDMTNIIVENIDSRELQKSKPYDLLLIDEAHHVAASTYQKLNKTAWSGIFYRFYLTATPFRNQKEETLLFEGIAGEIIYKLSYIDAIRDSYIVPVEAYYLELPKSETEAHTWAQVYSQLIVNNTERNLMIGALLLRLNQAKSSTLCLVKEIAHGKLLSELTGVPFVNGQDEESRGYIAQFNAGKLSALIGTEGVIGEGIDTRPCEYVIIAGLGKAKSAFMQKVGRGVRRYPGKESAKIILIKDKSHKFCLKHFNAQCTIMKQEYGIKPTKLEL